ncbi:hypothetical protein AC578_5733 [Pseudocercospora eumusae]|uniref:Major facilitator superfamily (MFS) profile domain-containing protein n=1 Tax=Pseudocercospora eumusae TaxID=321146 RepID=A0A139HEQ9_9PEZI|nr:hypothetical protein AC578_5733 [Pseudocercospora eumusae]
MDPKKHAPSQRSSDEKVEDTELAHQITTNDPGRRDHRADDDRADVARGRNADKIDRSYWLSVNFIGTLFATGMPFMGGIGGECDCVVSKRTNAGGCWTLGFGLIAPILQDINAEIGPSPNINWVSLANITCGAAFFLLVAWRALMVVASFFVFGSGLALIGSIVGATANSVNTLIASQVLIGIAAAFQQSFLGAIPRSV